MIKISIRNNFPDVARKMDQLAGDVAYRAMSRALNATVKQGQKDMARAISKEFMVTRKKAEDRLVVTPVRRNNELRLSVSLEARRPGGLHGNEARGMNLINFVENKVTMAEAKRRKRAGTLNQLRVKIKRSGGPKILRGAFIATSRKTGGTAVFMRVGKSRMPIETKTTIDIPQMFNTKRINHAVRTAMLNRFEANFNRELRNVLGGWVKR